LIVRGELASDIDSVAALEAELTALGRSYVVVNGELGDYPCNSAPFEIMWIMNGTFPDSNDDLTVASGAALLAHHNNGGGIYLESGDNWYAISHTVTAFDQIDGIDPGGSADGNDTFTAMDGFDSGLGLDLSGLQNVAYSQDQVGNDWTDQLAVAAADPGLTAAARIWALDDALGAAYTTGVFGQGLPGTGNVISCSFEFGGFGGDKNALAALYISNLGGGIAPTIQFKRGDCNADGGFNIADPIFKLGELFPTGVANDPVCDDACDANDDGTSNIADPIAMLGVLFPSTSPPPTLPAPGLTCGDDPTSDALTCGQSTSGCP
jgi:hypothetical protein